MKVTILPDCEMLTAKIYGRQEIEGREYAYGYGGVIDLIPSIPIISERAEDALPLRNCECCKEEFKTDKRIREPTISERERGRDRYHHLCKYCRHISSHQRIEKKNAVSANGLENFKKARKILDKNRKRKEITTIDEINEEIFAKKTLGRSTKQLEKRKQEIVKEVAEKEKYLDARRRDDEFESTERKNRLAEAERRDKEFEETWSNLTMPSLKVIQEDKKRTKQNIENYIENLHGVYNQRNGALSIMTIFKKLLFVLWETKESTQTEEEVISEVSGIFSGVGIVRIDENIEMSKKNMLRIVEELEKKYCDKKAPTMERSFFSSFFA